MDRIIVTLEIDGFKKERIEIPITHNLINIGTCGDDGVPLSFSITFNGIGECTDVKTTNDLAYITLSKIGEVTNRKDVERKAYEHWKSIVDKYETEITTLNKERDDIIDILVDDEIVDLDNEVSIDEKTNDLCKTLHLVCTQIGKYKLWIKKIKNYHCEIKYEKWTNMYCIDLLRDVATLVYDMPGQDKTFEISWNIKYIDKAISRDINKSIIPYIKSMNEGRENQWVVDELIYVKNIKKVFVTDRISLRDSFVKN